MRRLPSFRTRTAPHELPEKLDGDIASDTFAAYLASLAGVNAASFGYRPTLAFVDRAAARRDRGRPLTILDVGSGYGDTVRRLAAHLAARGIPAAITGVDRNPLAARVAGAVPFAPPGPVTVTYRTADASALGAEDPPDLIVSSLLAHHLEDGELVEFLRFMDRTARIGFFVNDLLRSRLAATAFPVLARLARRHPFIAHDGPVSFARAFRRADWEARLAEAGVTGASIGIRAPFRLCVEKFFGT